MERRPAPAPIPIANLLRMSFYAGGLLEELEDCPAAHEDGASFEELLRSMLVRASERIRRLGFERGYRSDEETTSRPRGRILLGDSISTGTIHMRRIACRFDEFGPDTPSNRVLKACARRLSRRGRSGPGLSDEACERLQALVREMREVGDEPLASRTIAALPRSIATRRYRVVRFIARLLADGGEPDEREDRLAEHWARTLVRDERRMRRLFERFVFRFARAHRPREASVGRPTFEWSEPPQTGVPRLETDVAIAIRDRIRIVECKYTPHLFAVGPYGSRSFRPEHLRQLFAYLSRASGHRRGSHSIDGVLLYPATDRRLSQPIDLGGFVARVSTLPLGEPWSVVRSELGELLFGDS